MKPRDPAWRQALRVYLTVRVLASLAALLGRSSIPATADVAAETYARPEYSRLMNLLFGVWEHSDAIWYIHLARDGYHAGSAGAAFFPVYPLLIRMVHSLTALPWICAALLVSNAAALASFYFMYRLCALERDEQFARRSLWLMALYPGAFFLLAPYSESTFLALALASYYAARVGRWNLACLAAAFLSATRVTGFLMLVPLAVEFVRQRSTVPLRQGLWLLLAPAGLIALMAFWREMQGDPLAFIHQQVHWERAFCWPPVTIWRGVEQAWMFAASAPGGPYILEAGSVVAAVALIGWALARFPVGYGLFALLMLLPSLCFPFPGRFLMSCIRFVAVLFPIFMAGADLLVDEESERVSHVFLAALYGLACGLYVSCQNMF